MISTLFNNLRGDYGNNLLINGGFDVWQRNPAGSAISYTAGQNLCNTDRWKLYSASITLPSFTSSRGTHSYNDLPNQKSYYYMRFSPSNTATLTAASELDFFQVIEHGTRHFANGRTLTVSFFARSSIGGKKLGIRLHQNYGSGGSPSTAENLTGTFVTLTSNWQRFTATFTTNTLNGKTFGTSNDDYLNLIFGLAWGTDLASLFGDSVSENIANGTIDISQVAFVPSSEDIDYWPRGFARELQLCMRYYEKSFPYGTAPADNAGRGGAIWSLAPATNSFQTFDFVPFHVTKRVSPATINGYLPEATNANKVRNLNASTNHPLGIINQSEYGFAAFVNNSSISAGQQVCFHYDVDVEQ